MTHRPGPRRTTLLVLGLVALVAVVALPALAAAPSASSGPGSGSGPKASREPGVAVTLRGVVGTVKDADGSTGYTLAVDGRTVRLDAGPAWFFGDKHPLAPFVGRTVTITGEQSGDEVDVETVDGVAIRAPGRLPWAGGWKAVGSAHPGWSQDKADRWAQRHSGTDGGGVGPFGSQCWPPGHCKSPEPAASGEPAAR